MLCHPMYSGLATVDGRMVLILWMNNIHLGFRFLYEASWSGV